MWAIARFLVTRIVGVLTYALAGITEFGSSLKKASTGFGQAARSHFLTTRLYLRAHSISAFAYSKLLGLEAQIIKTTDSTVKYPFYCIAKLNLVH